MLKWNSVNFSQVSSEKITNFINEMVRGLVSLWIFFLLSIPTTLLFPVWKVIVYILTDLLNSLSSLYMITLIYICVFKAAKRHIVLLVSLPYYPFWDVIYTFDSSFYSLLNNCSDLLLSCFRTWNKFQYTLQIL